MKLLAGAGLAGATGMAAASGAALSAAGGASAVVSATGAGAQGLTIRPAASSLRLEVRTK